jgi:hypothetical protein
MRRRDLCERLLVEIFPRILISQEVRESPSDAQLGAYPRPTLTRRAFVKERWARDKR